jgi:membrane-associated protease RseP (regulator of RpoE activity)
MERYGRAVRRTLTWLTIAISTVAFLLFVLRLHDSRHIWVRPKVTAPSVPDAGVTRDAELRVTLVERDNRTVDAGLDAGTSSAAKRLENAQVHAFWQKDREYFDAGKATTNVSGQAVLRSLPRGVLWVLAEAPGYARTSTQLILEGERRELTLSLETAHSLEVTVTDEQNQPLKQSTVLVTGHDPLPFGALTGTDAVARFLRLGRAPWTVKASASGYESVIRAGVTGSVTLALRRLSSMIVRVERAQGGPAVNALVNIAGTTMWPARSVRADSHGAALIHGLLAGSYDLRATLDNEVSRTELGVELKRGEEREVVLRLLPGRFANIRVTDGEATDAPPVPDAAVVVAESGLSSFPLHGRTGAAGTVRLGPIAPGPATASASAQDFVGGSTVAVPERPVADVRIALLRGATLIGRVLDVNDHVIAGASVEIVGTDEVGLPVVETPALRALRSAHFDWSLTRGAALLSAGELGVMPGPIPAIPGAAADLGDWGYHGTESPLNGANVSASGLAGAGFGLGELDPWVSRGDGTFRAHPVTPGRLRAIVRHPEYVEGISDVVALSPGGIAEVKVVLHEGGRLEGRVVDDRDFPVGGARVDLAATKGTTMRTTVTADDGSFAFAAVPLEVTLTVERSTSESQRTAVRRSLTLRESKRETVVIVLPAEREDVKFTVTDERGNPLENAELQVTSLSAEIPLKRTHFTNADGQVTLSDARGLALRLRCELPGFVPTLQTVESVGEALRVVLKRGVVVTGRVTSVRGRRTVEGAQVTIVTEGQRRVATTNSEGLWTVRDVAPGSIQVHVEHEDFAAVDRTAEVKPTGREDRAFEVEDVDLSEPGEVAGIVVDKAGNPVAGARVATYPVPAYLAAGSLPSTMAITRHDGHFVLKAVQAGTVTLHAYAPTLGRGTLGPIEVVAGRDTREATIRLTAPTGDEWITGQTASVAITLAEQNGNLTVTSVAPGSEAERAGIATGDVLLAIEGVHPDSLADARSRLSGSDGTDVLLELQRGGNHFKLRLSREPVRR